jgi:hypothetical protein
VAEAVKLTGDVASPAAETRFYQAKPKPGTPRNVADVVAEWIDVKTTREPAARYRDDLCFRPEKLAAAFPCPIGSVTTADVEVWLDGLREQERSKALKELLLALRNSGDGDPLPIDPAVRGVGAHSTAQAIVTALGEAFSIKPIHQIGEPMPVRDGEIPDNL